MDSTNEEDDRGDFSRHVRSGDFEITRTIAETLRVEFGDSIDAHPGGVGTEAGTINRAFRMAVGVILKEAGSPGEEPGLRTLVLRQIALERLNGLGVVGPRAEGLLDLEPGLGNSWLAYMALAPTIVIDDLLEHRTGEDEPRIDSDPA